MSIQITIDEIIKLDAERTQGKWEARLDGSYSVVLAAENRVTTNDYGTGVGLEEGDAKFIAASPAIAATAIELYNKNREMKEKIENLQDALEKAMQFTMCEIDSVDMVRYFVSNHKKQWEEFLIKSGVEKPVEQATDGWRPIDENTPRDKDFLVLIRSDFISSENIVCQACYMDDELAIYNEQHFGHFPLRESRRATHWQPLPKPPATED